MELLLIYMSEKLSLVFRGCIYAKYKQTKYKIQFCNNPTEATMSRIFISCVVLLFCVFSSCLATSPNVGEMPEHAQSELDIPYAGK